MGGEYLGYRSCMQSIVLSAFSYSLYFQEPVEIRVGSAYHATQFSGSKRKKILKTDTFQYIPIEETLKRVLQMPDIVNEINYFHGSNSDCLMDRCDGSVFRTHPIFSTDKRAIQVIAYVDEIELCNPLGSSTKKHKLACLFFTIGNLRPNFRSRLKCIFVTAVASSIIINKHGMNSFLKPFVESMKTLSKDGVKISINGEECRYQVGVLATLADTLAAHSLGGFKESMSFAYRICRSCMATTEQIQFSFVESDFELRTPAKHKDHLRSLNGSSHASNSTKFGVNRPSELDNIPFFSVVMNLPHDVMHDLFEGVIPYEMKLLLAHLVNAKYFTIGTVNERLRQFDFGYTERSDIPSQLDEKNFMRKPEQKIRQSASKMWLLAIVLPLLVGDLVPENCEFWIL